VRNDWLDLRVPVWVSQVCFVPETGGQPTVAVGTGYHQVCVILAGTQYQPNIVYMFVCVRACVCVCNRDNMNMIKRASFVMFKATQVQNETMLLIFIVVCGRIRQEWLCRHPKW